MILDITLAIIIILDITLAIIYNYSIISIYQDFFNNVELSYNDFANICNKVWKEPYNYIVIDITKNKNINGKLRINWDGRVL